MNISLTQDKISVKGLSELGDYFTVTDSIGFSEGNADEGYNRSGAVFQDAEGEVYPQISQTALVLYAYLNQYDKNPSKASVTGVKVREDSDVVDYSEVAFNQRISIVGDGWYTIHAFLLPVDDGTESIYYESSSGNILENGIAIEPAALVDKDGVEGTVLHTFVSPLMEKELATKVGALVDIAKKKGITAKEYKQMQHTVFYFDGQITGARIQFEDGHYYEAQETIEDLINGDPYVNC